MGDDTGDDEALARALAAQEEEHAYALGVEYPTFRPPAKRRRPDPAKEAKPSGPETATEPPREVPAKDRPAPVTLAHLIDYGVVVPGKDALLTSYCDVTTTAHLEADGTIGWRNEKFHSVSAFSLAFKRSVKPDRKADDGWKCVRYVGFRASNGGDADRPETNGHERLPERLPADSDKEKPLAGPTLDALKRRFADDGSARAAAAARGDCAAVAAARARSDAERAAREAAKPQKPPKVVKEKAVKPKVSKPQKKKPDPKPKPPPPPPVDRPRRTRKPPRGFFAATSDLQMVECEKYEEGEQPWFVTCSFEALALMDFHAHLSSDTEIIGFLGGKWDAEKRTLQVQRALPARRLPSADAGVEVELDPACVPEIVDALERDRQRVVGWYHSHPTFATTPSLRDCENQANYQSLFDASEPNSGDDEKKTKKKHATRVPFVGAIVGPYRGTLDPVAEMTWFHVDADAENGVLQDACGLAGVPKEVRVDRDVIAPEIKNEKDVFHRLRDDAFALADVFGRGAERFDHVDLFKPWGSIVADQTVSDEPATRLTKMLRSLRSRVQDAASVESTNAFVDAVAEKTKSAWLGDAENKDA